MAYFQRDGVPATEGVITLDIDAENPVAAGFQAIKYWIAISATESPSAVGFECLCTDRLENDVTVTLNGGTALDGTVTPSQVMGEFTVFFAGHDENFPSRKLKFILTPIVPLALGTLTYDYWIQWS